MVDFVFTDIRRALSELLTSLEEDDVILSARTMEKIKDLREMLDLEDE
jgi:hypothetical protein